MFQAISLLMELGGLLFVVIVISFLVFGFNFSTLRQSTSIEPTNTRAQTVATKPY